MNLKIILILAMGLLAGCASKYIYPSDRIDDALIQKSEKLKSIVLALDRSEDNDYGHEGIPRPPSDLQSFYKEMSKLKIFKEVNFKNNMISLPDVILSHYRYSNPEFKGIHGESGGFLCNIYLSMLTLFIVPTYCDSDHHVTFRLTNGSNSNCIEEIEIERKAKSVFGWFAPIFRINPNWYASSTSNNLDTEYQKSYKAYAVSKVLEHTETFIKVSNCG